MTYKIAGHECVENIRAFGDRIIVNIDSVAGSSFCNSARSVLRGSDLKVLETKFYGIVKEIGDLFVLSLFKNCSGDSEATQIVNLSCVKIAFSDQGSLILALRLGLKIEYELIHVFEFKKIPRCCNDCQSPEHLIVNCPSTCCKCARYSGPHEYCRHPISKAFNSSSSVCS